LDKRLGLEVDLKKFYVKKNIFSPEDNISVFLDDKLTTAANCRFKITEEYSELRQVDIGGARVFCDKSVDFDGEFTGETVLLRGNGLPDGDYKIEASAGGITCGGFIIKKRTVYDLPSEPEYKARKEWLLGHFAQNRAPLAQMALGAEAPSDSITLRQKLDGVNKRFDCSDFVLHELLRLYGRYGGLLPNGLGDEIKAAILNFKYWPDEDGASMMFTRSENHQFCFHSAEYIAGQLFPNEIFSNSGLTGLFHSLKGKQACLRWMREKGRYGFTEWHSNTYCAVNVMSLVDLYDFSENDPEVKNMARNLLDFILLLMASHSHGGIMACTHGRGYEERILNPENEETARMMWLLTGAPKRYTEEFSGVTAPALHLCESGYYPPSYIEETAAAENLDTLTRMGIYPHSGLRGVLCSCYRAHDYMVSGMIDSRKGEFGAQVHAGQLLLDKRLPVFVSCFESAAANTRPSYWGGQYRIPRTIAYKNILAYIFRLEDKGFTHCYFPFEDFDEVAEHNGWIFGRANEAYAAVYCTAPYTVTGSGKYKKRELLCGARNVVWLLEAGSKTLNGTFDEFARSFPEPHIEPPGNAVDYNSPVLGEVRLSWDGKCFAGGKAVTGKEFPLINNKYAHGDYGSGYISLKGCGYEKLIFDF
jgi:hypothetical protein